MDKKRKKSAKYIGKNGGFCEHCGNLKKGIPYYEDRGCHWCSDCMEANGWTEKELEEMRA